MATFSSLAYYLETYGVMDFLLPFLLVFTISFAVLQKAKILGDGKKQYNVVVSLVLGLLFVVPHITGSYPLGYDPVDVMNATLPSISLIAVAAIMVLLLLGIFGTQFAAAAVPWIGFISLAFVVYIFGAALNLWTGPSDIFGWWSPETTEILIIVLVFGLLVWFITKDDSKPGKGIENVGNVLGKFFEKAGGKG
jgi:hypothetical protein